MTRVKICGVTTPEDAIMCTQAGTDMLGLNFYPPSPRYVTPEQARQIIDGLRQAAGRAYPLLIGVFVNASAAEIVRMIEQVGLDAAQLSGDESSETLAELHGHAFKAVRPRSRIETIEAALRYLPYTPQDPRLPALLVDAYHQDLFGGTGEQASLEVALTACALARRLMLAGGLTPDNVAARVQAVRPWGVDVASGVESAPGVKDGGKVRAFVAAARSVEA